MDDFKDALFSISNRRWSLTCQKNRGQLSPVLFQMKTGRLNALETQLKTRCNRGTVPPPEDGRMTPMRDGDAGSVALTNSSSPSIRTLDLRSLSVSDASCNLHDSDDRAGCRPSFTMLVYQLKLRCYTVPKVRAAMRPRASELTLGKARGSLAHRQKTLAKAWARGHLSERQIHIESNILAGHKQRLHGWSDVQRDAARTSIESFVRDGLRGPHLSGNERPDPSMYSQYPARSGSSLLSVSLPSDIASIPIIRRGSDPDIGEFGITRL